MISTLSALIMYKDALQNEFNTVELLAIISREVYNNYKLCAMMEQTERQMLLLV